MGYWKKVQVELDEIGDSTDGIDIEKEMRKAMMNEYTIKGVSYSQVEARSEAEAIQKYKENILDYICDNWEVEVIESEVK
tara:strand:+ start:446 stop:685 length:240 start_codon:yes stop_codon:yes gene_type:complete